MRKDNQKPQQDGKYQNAEEKAMDRFCDLMIDRLQDIQHDWKKPWFSESAIAVPRNLSGRQYNGMNSVMLMLHCQKNNYDLPVFCTFDRVSALNFTKDKQGAKQQIKDGRVYKIYYPKFMITTATTGKICRRTSVRNTMFTPNSRSIRSSTLNTLLFSPVHYRKTFTRKGNKSNQKAYLIY